MAVTFLLAPGAGAPCSSSWMLRWARLLEAIGPVRAFDYPYMAEGRKRPDPLPKLIAAHRSALQQWRDSSRGPVVLIGKSMGSRVGCHVSLQEEVPALVCLGYPLCGGGDPAKLRDQVLREIRTTVLFVQGTRDPLCPLPLLGTVRAEMSAPNRGTGREWRRPLPSSHQDPAESKPSNPGGGRPAYPGKDSELCGGT